VFVVRPFEFLHGFEGSLMESLPLLWASLGISAVSL
jgi:hypothetical protein